MCEQVERTHILTWEGEAARGFRQWEALPSPRSEQHEEGSESAEQWETEVVAVENAALPELGYLRRQGRN